MCPSHTALYEEKFSLSSSALSASSYHSCGDTGHVRQCQRRRALQPQVLPNSYEGCGQALLSPSRHLFKEVFNPAVPLCPSQLLPSAHLSCGARLGAHDARREGDAAERDCLGEVVSISSQ